MRYFVLLVSSVLFPAAARAAAPASGGGPAMMNIIPILLMFAIVYFMLIRPQQKQQKELQKMVDALKRGDRILTQGGIYATVSAVKGKVLEVKLNDDVKVLMSKSAVSQVVSGDPAQEPIEPIVVNGAKTHQP